jgi:hypothetical protein
MEYNFNRIEQKWQAYWKENNTYKVEVSIIPNQNSMCLICFHTHPEPVCMWDIPLDISHPIFTAATKD